MIEAFGVGKVFGRNALALWDISFVVPKGQLMAITGPSGSGKTTLLRIVSGQLRPTEGHVLVDGVNLAGIPEKSRSEILGRTIGVAPAQPLFLNNAPVIKTILLALAGIRVYGNVALQKAKQLLELVGLLHRSNSPVSALSQLQRRLLSIARSLAGKPKALLVDEPILGLDNSAAKEIITILNRASDRGATVLLATRAEGLLRDLSVDMVRLAAGRFRDCEQTRERLNTQEGRR